MDDDDTNSSSAIPIQRPVLDSRDGLYFDGTLLRSGFLSVPSVTTTADDDGDAFGDDSDNPSDTLSGVSPIIPIVLY